MRVRQNNREKKHEKDFFKKTKKKKQIYQQQWKENLLLKNTKTKQLKSMKGTEIKAIDLLLVAAVKR